MVSVCGVVVVTIALVCVLSVFNGFNDLVAMLFSNLEPDLKIKPSSGKVFDPSIAEIQNITNIPQIVTFSQVLQDNALIRYGERQVLGTIKGVDQNYEQLTRIDSVLVDGHFTLREDVVDYATLGLGLAYTLGVKPGFVSPIEIYAPKRNGKVNMAMPASSFEAQYAYAGATFRINRMEYDDSYMIVPLELARSLFRYTQEISAVELKLSENANVQDVKKEIKKILGNSFIVQDRYEQQEASYKMMQIEKAMTFLILTFILAIALFNLVGSLSMLMTEKKDDIQTLRNMGADENLIKKIFLFEGWMISASGVTIGVAIGIILCVLQMNFGLIRLGQEAAFVINAYPIKIIATDIILVYITVLIIGFLSSWYPVHHICKKWFAKKGKA